jgi:sialate O-acetylesterase
MIRLILTLWLSISCAVFATVKPAGIFTDGTVLQRGAPVRIWGTADPGESVTVAFAGQKKTGAADADGNWMVTLDSMPASSEPRKLQVSGLPVTTLPAVASRQPLPSAVEFQVSFADVLVGEVWLAGGQSNMASPMSAYSKTSQPDIDGANDPLLRMVTIPRLEYAGQNDAVPQWLDSTPAHVDGFSASAYYFAKNLREALDVPVGIVTCCVGATPAEAWMSRKTLESREDLKRILTAYESGVQKQFPDGKGYAEANEACLKASREWVAVRNSGKNPGPRPQQPMGPMNYRRPAGLHETMLTQTIPYTVRGAIWYQGENNANAQAGDHYETVFSTLIEEWRTEFRNPAMPFLFVQLATYGPAADSHPYWPELREAQRRVEQKVENTGMAVLVDGGEEKNIHPHSKDKVGRRLSLLARKLAYGEESLVCRGPRFESSAVDDGTIALSFADAGAGLLLKPAAAGAFEICGADGNYVPAAAELVGGRIVVSSPAVSEPLYVRYGWKKWFVPTLFNQEGLPAVPFRTDPFPLQSAGRYYLDTLR